MHVWACLLECITHRITTKQKLLKENISIVDILPEIADCMLIIFTQLQTCHGKSLIKTMKYQLKMIYLDSQYICLKLYFNKAAGNNFGCCTEALNKFTCFGLNMST